MSSTVNNIKSSENDEYNQWYEKLKIRFREALNDNKYIFNARCEYGNNTTLIQENAIENYKTLMKNFSMN